MKALLLSGGMDSVAIAWWLRPDLAISVDYGQRPAQAELQAAGAVCSALGLRHEIVRADCSATGSGHLAGRPALAQAPVPEWWPFRNQLILTLAGITAIRHEVRTLLIGALATDGEHADGRPHFIDGISRLMALQEGGLTVEAPAIAMTAVELVRQSGVPRTFWPGPIPATSATSPAAAAADASSTTRPGRPSVGTLIDGTEAPACSGKLDRIRTGAYRHRKPSPANAGQRAPFPDVLMSRRSEVGGSIGWHEVASVLRHSTLPAGPLNRGRAGMLVDRRPSPSAGALHPIALVCIDDRGDAPRLYEPTSHVFHLLAVDAVGVTRLNGTQVEAVTGHRHGCTVRFLADMEKAAAAYEEPVSLVLRDAGCLLATLCLVAEWLGLGACPLGFLGQQLVAPLGFPEKRFLAVGGVQLGDKTERGCDLPR